MRRAVAIAFKAPSAESVPLVISRQLDNVLLVESLKVSTAKLSKSEEREERMEALLAVGRLVISIVVLVAIVSLVGYAFRHDLARFGHWFVDRFGLIGVAGGSLLADAFHFPLPPQFYLLTGIASGSSPWLVVLAVLLGSELGGFVAFSIGRTLAHRSNFLRARIEEPRKLITRMIDRRGYFGLALATLFPVSFCILCVASGMMQLPYRAYGVLAAMRVPRILLSYAVIVFVWL